MDFLSDSPLSLPPSFAIRAVLSFLLASLVIGQLVRFPLPGQGGGVLVSDIAVPLVLISAGIIFVGHKEEKNTKTKSTLPAGRQEKPNILALLLLLTSPFLAWSLFSLVIHLPDLEPYERLIAFSYWVRLAAYVLLLPAFVILVQDEGTKRFLTYGFLVTAALLAVIGFLQLVIFPDVTGGGWDPHRGRLVSTWLDPNFVGLFFVLAGITAIAYRAWLPLFLFLTALVLTQSRSSIGALMVVLFAVSPLLVLKLRMKMVGIVGLLVVISIIVVLLLGDRALGVLMIDETMHMRLASLSAVWRELIQEQPWVGVGYNAYQFAAADAGLLDSFTIHSRAGADSSLFTLWATTGLVGVVLFLIPWMYASSLGAAAAASVGVVLVHSLAVNSFLYSHILVTLSIVCVLCMSER